MKTRWKILGAAATALLLICVSLFISLHTRPASDVEAYKKFLRDHGEKLEISEVLPPPVPDASNGASLLQSAFTFLPTAGDDYTNQPFAMQMIAPGRAIIGWKQPNLAVPGLGGYTNSWENASQSAEKFRPALALLDQAASYPAFDFHLDYGKGEELLLKHLAPLKKCAQQLSASAMCDLHHGRAASATTNICTILNLVRNDHDERVVISHYVRLAMNSFANSATWELLQFTNVTEAELNELQNAWNQQEFIQAAEHSFLMERATTESTIEDWRAHSRKPLRLISTLGGYGSSGSSGPSEFWEDLKGRWNDMKVVTSVSMWQLSWSYPDELRTLRSQQEVLETLREVETNAIFFPAFTNMTKRLAAVGVTNQFSTIWPDVVNLRSFFSQNMDWLARAVPKTMAAEAGRQIVITAIALKRFELKHARLPQTLAELTPDFLPSVPRDSMDGHPLRYHPNPDSTFLLYSIGLDGIDDGGNPAHSTSPPSPNSSLYWLNPDALDWVWPQPATAAEIQNYFDHPSK